MRQGLLLGLHSLGFGEVVGVGEADPSALSTLERAWLWRIRVHYGVK